MDNILYKVDNLYYPPNVALWGVWEVHADMSYDRNFFDVDADDYVAIRTVSGFGTIIFGGRQLLLEKDSLLIVRHKDITRYYCSHENWTFYWFVFYGNLPPQLQLDNIFILKTDYNELQLITDLCNQINISGSTKAMNISLKFSSLVIGWIQKMDHEDDIDFLPENFLNIILAHENRNCSVAHLAELCYMSERNFRLIFQKHFKMSPIQFFLKRKLETAYELLNSNDIKVKEVAINCGFTNQYYFCKMFKKRYGHPPSELKRKSVKKPAIIPDTRTV